jgi:hypothetical protein
MRIGPRVFRPVVPFLYYLSSLGLASLTTIFLPSISELFNASIAFLASSSFDISTNPNQRERPVILSFKTTAETTSPNWEKRSPNFWSSTAQGREPTKSFVIVITANLVLESFTVLD